MFSQSWAVLIPILSLGLSDVLLNIHLGIDPYSVLSVRNLLLLIPFWVGVILARKGETGAKTLLLSTVGNTVVFYLLSNTYSWATDTFYQKSLSGWTLALTVGYPQFPPTWEFGLRSLTGDLAFMGVVVAFRLKFFEKEDKRQFA